MKKRTKIGGMRGNPYVDLREGDKILEVHNPPGGFSYLVVEREVPLVAPELPGWRRVNYADFKGGPYVYFSHNMPGGEAWYVPEG